MGSEESRCVVGIDVAKQSHVVCALPLQAPSGSIQLKPSQIAASAEGYAHVHAWLQSWAGSQDPRRS